MLEINFINPLYPPFFGGIDIGGHPQTLARRLSGLLYKLFWTVVTIYIKYFLIGYDT
jgi:hypothetical protein